MKKSETTGSDSVVTAAVLAAGSGKRMGSEIPKQFLEIDGEPIVIKSVKKFLDNKNTDAVVVAVPAFWLDYMRALLKDTVCSKPVYVIAGAATRGDTLVEILRFMTANGLAGENDIVLTHDAVRPFINDRIIDGNIAAAEKYGACNTCVPATDTILTADSNGFIASVPPRKTVYHAQTPQSFNAKKLYELCLKTPEKDFEEMTDGCSVFIYHGEPVFITEGDRANIKITYPEDLK